MIDWRDLEAGPELDILIALRLGWTDIRASCDDPNFDFDQDAGPIGKNPQGMVIYVPQWSTSVDAALTLPIDTGYDWSLKTDRHRSIAQIFSHKPPIFSRNPPTLAKSLRDTMAHAMVCAWIIHMDREERKGEE